jgi:hypothetical protein
MQEIDLKALQTQSVADIQKSLGDLDRDQLTELLALEADANAPRETLTKAITARIDKLDADNAAPAEAEPAKAEPAKPAPFTSPDYAGPLTIEQAEWRARNLKPAKVAAKK